MEHILSIIMLFSWPVLILLTYSISRWALKKSLKKIEEQETVSENS